eukprot:8534746-Pyramimonas_sp.AAC.1
MRKKDLEDILRKEKDAGMRMAKRKKRKKLLRTTGQMVRPPRCTPPGTPPDPLYMRIWPSGRSSSAPPAR